MKPHLPPEEVMENSSAAKLGNQLADIWKEEEDPFINDMF